MNSYCKLRKNQTHKYLSLKHHNNNSPDHLNHHPLEQLKQTQKQLQVYNQQNKQIKSITKDFYYRNELKNKALKKHSSKNLQAISSTSFLIRRKHFSLFYHTEKQKQQSSQFQSSTSNTKVSVQGINHVKKALNFNSKSLFNTKQRQKQSINPKQNQQAISRNKRNYPTHQVNQIQAVQKNQQSIKQLQSHILMKNLKKNNSKNQQTSFDDHGHIFKKRKVQINCQKQQTPKINFQEKETKAKSIALLQTAKNNQQIHCQSQKNISKNKKEINKISKNPLPLLQKNQILNNFILKKNKNQQESHNINNKTTTRTQITQIQANLNINTKKKSVSSLSSIKKIKVSSLSKDKLKTFHYNQKLMEKRAQLKQQTEVQRIVQFDKDKNKIKNKTNQQLSKFSQKNNQTGQTHALKGNLKLKLKQNKAMNQDSSLSMSNLNLSGVFQQNLKKIRSKKKELKLKQFEHNFDQKNITDRQIRTQKQEFKQTAFHLPHIKNFHSTQQIYLQDKSLEYQIQEIQQTEQIQQIQQISDLLNQKEQQQVNKSSENKTKILQKYLQTQTKTSQKKDKNNFGFSQMQQIHQDIMSSSMHSIQCSAIHKNSNDDSFLSSTGQQLIINIIQNDSLQQSLPQLKRLIENKDKKRKVDIEKIRKRFPQDFFK